MSHFSRRTKVIILWKCIRNERFGTFFFRNVLPLFSFEISLLSFLSKIRQCTNWNTNYWLRTFVEVCGPLPSFLWFSRFKRLYRHPNGDHLKSLRWFQGYQSSIIVWTPLIAHFEWVLMGLTRFRSNQFISRQQLAFNRAQIRSFRRLNRCQIIPISFIKEKKSYKIS